MGFRSISKLEINTCNPTLCFVCCQMRPSMKPGYYEALHEAWLLPSQDYFTQGRKQCFCYCTGCMLMCCWVSISDEQYLYVQHTHEYRIMTFLFYSRLSASCVHVSALLHALVHMFSTEGAPLETESDSEGVVPITSLACKWVKPRKQKERAH